MHNHLVDWCSAQWFSLVHRNHLVYNTCWEDPRIDRKVLELGPDDRLVTITSAGCNTLDYALQGPRHIYAVDVNPRQNALLELKMAGIRELDFDDFFALFGRGRHPGFRSLYRQHLRPQLSEAAALHWDRNQHYFDATDAHPGFYFRGASGLFARVLGHYIDLNRIREPINAIFNASSIAEQDYIYRTVLHRAFWTDLLRWVLQWDLPFALLGVPRAQRRQVEVEYQGGMRQFIEDSLEAVFARLPLKDNYFWWLYFNGEYSPERCPEYLRKENFLKLKDGLVDRISVHTATFVEFLKAIKEQLTRFVLLDHMDWLRGKLQPVLAEEWQLFAQVAAPNARLLWRSAALRADFVNDIVVHRGQRSARVGELLHYHHRLASRLHQEDRVHTYGSFAIADWCA